MPPPADIIAFSKDWNEPKTSNNHVLEELAKHHRVLWVNSIATRNPNLGSVNDLKKIARKIRSWFAGIQVVHPRLRILTPVVLPFPRSRIAQSLNRWLTVRLVRRAARQWGIRQPQLWIFPPNAADYIGQLGESKVVYYCVDEWSQFTHLNAAFILAKEQELLAKADTVFVVSQKLLDAKRPFNSNTHLIPHGVDFDLFGTAFSHDRPIPADLQEILNKSLQSKVCGLRSPIIGFYGNLYDWVDQELIAGVAARRPHWSVVLIGKVMTDIAGLQKPNIHILGPRPFEDLPAYCRGFDVGIIPYKITDVRMQSVNPLKLREYLAAGLPVVSVDIPEVRAFGHSVRLARTADEFVAQIEQALGQNSDRERQARRESVRADSWTARVAEIERILTA